MMDFLFGFLVCALGMFVLQFWLTPALIATAEKLYARRRRILVCYQGRVMRSFSIADYDALQALQNSQANEADAIIIDLSEPWRREDFR